MCLRTNLEGVGRGSRPNKRRATSSPKGQKNSEKRKEKSRDAARCRRGKESEIFNELGAALPLPSQTVSQLDKASVMRLTIAYLKTRALCQAGLPKVKDEASSSSKLGLEMDSMLMEALDGFLLVLSTDGDVVYTSENIVIFLGLSQVDVMGQSLYEYTHPCDHEEVKDLVAPRTSNEPRHAFLRLKSTITTKGRNVNLKSATYKVVQVSGEVVQHEEEQSWLVALGTPVPHPSNIEFPLDKQTFVSKHSLNMKFTYVDDNVDDFCGYRPEDLVGRSLYEMHHALDSDRVKDAFKTLRSKGQVETGQYRFLARGGGYVWLVTQATLIHGPKDHKPQYVVCLNYVVSGVEAPEEVLSEVQLMCNSNNNNTIGKNKDQESSVKVVTSSSPQTSNPVPSISPTITPTLPLAKPTTQPKVVNPTPRVPSLAPPQVPVATTFKIFTPRTEDMNKGYLVFSEDDPQCTVLKEEPDDLTHLAPSGGDTCVRLEVPTFMPDVNDMFAFDYTQIPVANADVLFANTTTVAQEKNKISNYEKNLINDSKQSSRLSDGNIIINSAGNSPASSCCSPHVGGLRTPEPPKPLLSQAAILPPQEKRLSFGTAVSSFPITTTESFFSQLDDNSNPTADDYKLDLKMEDQNMDADEFDMRAPYIPLSNEMLMLNPDDLIMWGAEMEPALSPKNQLLYNKDPKTFTEDSSLAQLLRDTDPPITGCAAGGTHKAEGVGDQPPPYEQNKFFDGSENFVDPNKVLPGHCIGKDDGLPGQNTQSEDDPPVAMVLETVEPPPPLVTIDTRQMSLSIKRGHSPSSSPIPSQKKLCSLSSGQRQLLTAHPSGQEPMGLQVQQSGVGGGGGGMRVLTTPYAPTMQQLLISKDPITVPGRHHGGGTTNLQNPNERGHSVLRNLLNTDEEGCILSGEPQPGGSGLNSSQQVQVLSGDRMTSMIVSGGGGTHANGQIPTSKLRFLAGSQGGTLMPAGHLAFKVTSNLGKPPEQGRLRLQLMDPDLTIPNLLDLTQLDYEVNAPASNSHLLQGSDLLMALDKSP